MTKTAKPTPISNLGRLPGPLYLTGVPHFYDVLHEWVSDWYKGHPRHAEHPWRLVVMFEHGGAYAYALHAEVFPSKQHLFAIHKDSCNFPNTDPKNKVACSALICEAWMRQMQKDEERLFDSLGDDPKSIEGVMFNLITPTQQAIMTCKLDRTGQKGATLEKTPFGWLGDPGGPYERVEGSAVRDPVTKQ